MTDRPVGVLVVDDRAAFRRAASAVVAMVDGFQVAGEASTGEQAISFLERQRAELVLMDVNMPGIGGIQAAKHIRRHFPGVRIVLMSICFIEDLPAEVSTCGAVFCHKDGFGPDRLEELWNDQGQRS